ncbi:hypothetical protein [Roseimicrobium sp. ORNL1]|uniref:hypothetical protein n=1 Tax=Roseimicrobium sp. ORNL1 TaxID=2711231 RepID=UPI0013E11DD1|nr:hypothetical protein [Roseimicrobium sp. ORNL1]QIF04777.1 hypothetical protein G5S37_25760 [Roseimicrobium sp. ORNL1]
MNFRLQRPLSWRKSLRRGGFTLLETSMGVSITLALSVALIAMLQQHITLMGWLQKQSFLTTEAPQIGNLVGRIFGSADHYFVYSSRDAALGGAAPVLVNGGAVRLFSQAANGDITELWVEVQTVAGTKVLKCYGKLPNGTESQWTVCEGLGNATFHCNTGVLGVTLTGPNQEEVTYYGGSR